MVVFPNCKINLGLRITRKRPDGFHDLETVFYPLPLHDALEIIQTPDNDVAVLSTSGIPIPGNSADNLCMKAFNMLKADFPMIRSAHMHLHKAVPLGAGLGGGSADGAFTISLLNKFYKLGLSSERLSHYALRLGSDAPFFILNEPCLATGRGEVLKPIKLDLSSYTIVLVHPGIHVDTATAFSSIQPTERSDSIAEIVSKSVDQWKGKLINDFEQSIFLKYPEIEEIKTNLYEAGALYASMSGSGSAVYGIFPEGVRPSLIFPSKYFLRQFL